MWGAVAITLFGILCVGLVFVAIRHLIELHDMEFFNPKLWGGSYA